MKHHSKFYSMLAAISLLPVLVGESAVITWGAATTISGDADVSTNGTALYAYARGITTASTNVNSVAFTAASGNSAWGNVIFNASFTANTASAYASNAVPFSGLSSAYKTVLQGGAYGGATTGTVTLSELVFGRSYSVQIWVDDSRSTGSGRSQSVSSGGGNTVTLDYNNINAGGGVGQFTIGTFVADDTNQSFTLASSSSVQLNAIQVRDNGYVGVQLATTPTRFNLAKYQPVVTDSTNGTVSASYLTAGFVTDNSGWVSDNSGPHWAQVTFPFPVTVGSAQLAMGLNNASPLTVFYFQYLTNGNWVTVPGSPVSANTNVERNIVFTSPITSSAFRVYDSLDNPIRIRQIALYPPNGPGGFPFGTDFMIDVARKQPTFATANTYGNWPLLAADGLVDPSSAWKTTLVGSNALQINLQFTNKIGSAHLYSGMVGVPPLTNFLLQYWTGSAWANIPGGNISGNTNGTLVIPFTTPVTTTKVQLVFTNYSVSAVQELCIYQANSNGGYPLGTGIVSNTPATTDYDTYSDSYYYLSNSATAKVVIESNGVPVMGEAGATNWSGQYQVLLNYDNGTYRLINRNSGLCLAGAQLTTNAGAQLAEETYSALPDQEWFLKSIDGSNFYLVNQFSGLVADTLNGTLVQNILTNSPTQRWQISLTQIYPKKGIAGSSRAYQITFESNWTYGWWYTSDPNVPGVNYFPMDPDSWYRGSTVAGNLWGFQPVWRTKGYSLNIMGYNEPDVVGQANLDATNGAIYYMNDHCLDLPMAGPAAGNVNGSWNQIFFGYITNWGCRVDYLPAHEYPGNSSSASSSIWINPMQTAYNTYGIPMWMTEFSVVDWAGTGSWSEEDNYNALAEFMWRAESVSWLRKYSLFVFTADTNMPMAINPWTRTTPAPRSNTYDTNGNLTPFGELYAAWDCDANVESNKVYYIHNNGTRKRLQNTLGANANATDIRVSDSSTKWTLMSAGSPNLYYIVSAVDGRRLSYNGGSVGYVAAGTTGTAVQWNLTANQYGWFYLDHPATGLRLQLAFNNSTSVATFTMVATTTTTTAVQWRFIATLAPLAWTGFTNASWTIPGNWSSQQSPMAGQPVTFNSLSTTNLATTLNANFKLSGLSVTTPAGPVSVGGTNTLTLVGGGIDLSSASQDLTITAPLVLSADQTWNLASNRTLNINGGVSDNGSGFNLTVAGGGKVSLGGAATHTGDTTVNAGGTLQMGAVNVLPSGAGVGNMIVNGTLDLNGRAETVNGLSGSGVVDNTGVGAATLTAGDNDVTTNFSGTIQDTGGALALVKNSTGGLTLSGTNTYSGGTIISGGSLRPGNINAIGAGTLTVNSGGIFYPIATLAFTNPVTLNGGTLEIGGSGGKVLSHNGPVTVTTNSNIKADGGTYGIYVNGGLDMGSGGYTLSCNNGTVGNGNQISGITGANGTIMNSGIGNLWITGSNTFAGTFRATNSGPLIFSSVYALQNATLDMNAADIGAVILSTNVIIGALTGSRDLNLGTGTSARAISIGNNNASTTYNGAMTNSGSLIKIGSGTLILNGTNTYTGLTIVSAGTLGGTGVITGPVTVAAGGTLAPGNSLGTLTINNSFTNTGTVFMELNAGSLTADQVTGVLNASYGGSLVVSNLSGTSLAAGQAYQLFSASGTKTSNFASITLQGTGASGLTGAFNPANGQLILSSAVVPQPVINQVSVANGNLILQGINGTASSTYSIITATNVATSIANWTTNTTGIFGAGGVFSNGIPLGTEPARFFQIKTP